MKIDKDALKKQVILHLPYLLFLLVFAKLGEAVRLAQGRTLHRNYWGCRKDSRLPFRACGRAPHWTGWWDYAALPLSVWRSISKERMRKNTAKM